MRRREAIAALCGIAAVWPLAASGVGLSPDRDCGSDFAGLSQK
jgi:hypothetical protein